MSKSFNEIVQTKSTEKLKSILLNYSDYQPQFVKAAEEELQRRGIILSIEEKQAIETKKIADQEGFTNDIAYRKFLFNFWEDNIVEDQSAPKLFPRSTIIISSCLFTALFGGILFSLNLVQMNKKKPILFVLLVALLLSGLMIFFLYGYFQSGIHERYILKSILGINFLISGALYSKLWWNYIGKNIPFRLRSFFPLPISKIYRR